ncbi:hypothetical protein AVEN_249199-1 [Araneus ventricosus]|uniref:Uncharacterized protein n=1 Tax=Araneus ventricosus TaxID=182803 RepID=A0A4Y2P3J9_ARAVE|nr:hypothetical protein AVEN_249199-1 [Araneus ventricosus]
MAALKTGPRSIYAPLLLTAKPLVEEEMFDGTSFVLRCTRNEKFVRWTLPSVPISNIWKEIFTAFNENDIFYKNIGKLVEFCLCLPRTNGATECVFSFMTTKSSEQ